MNPDIQAWLSELEHDGQLIAESLQAAYRTQMRQHHPDCHHGDGAHYDRTLAKSKAINAAYAHLGEWLDTRGRDTPTTPKAQANGSSTRQRQDAQPASGFPEPYDLEVYVKSSNLYSCGYAAAERVLYIKFRDGAIYRYSGVNREFFEELLQSDSLGRFAHKKIYYKFRSERCL